MAVILAFRNAVLLSVSLYLCNVKASPYGTYTPSPVTAEPSPSQVAAQPVFVWTALPEPGSGFGVSYQIAGGSDQSTDLISTLPVPTEAAIGTIVRRTDTPWMAAGFIPGFNYALKASCETSGLNAPIDKIGTYATDACAAFISNLPGGHVVDNKWFRFAVTNVLDSTGGTSVLNYRWKRLSENSPILSEGICHEAYRQLSTVICTEGEMTRNGGTLQVAGDDGYEIGIDPDSMGGFKLDDGRYNNVGQPMDVSRNAGRV